MEAGPAEHPGIDDLGGAEAVTRIIRRFYDKVYAHPVLGPLFARVRRERQEQRLAGFIRMTDRDSSMSSIHGRFLETAHAHLAITAEMAAIRRALLCEAAAEDGRPAAVVESWGRFDDGWQRFVVRDARSQPAG